MPIPAEALVKRVGRLISPLPFGVKRSTGWLHQTPLVRGPYKKVMKKSMKKKMQRARR